MVDLKKLIAGMTIDEKIGQLVQYNAKDFIDSIAEITGPLVNNGLVPEDLYRVGSLLNLENAKDMIKLQTEHLEGDRNKIPIIFMMDVIHGYKTIFPIPLALGCSFDTELVEECTRMSAKEASSAGIQVTFTPMVDYVRDARWGRVMETCGEEPMLNAVMGAAQIKAFHGEDLSKPGGIATCVKHFAGYGGAESGKDYNQVELSEHILREFYLPAYKACIDAGTDMLMPSFNVLNGVPSTANKWLMQDVLRDEWGFEGVVISDYAAIVELITHGIAPDKKAAAKLAFQNGCDIEMCSNTYIKHLKEMIEEGIFTEQQLDNCVWKVLELKKKVGLFDDPFRGASPEMEEKTCLTPENRAIVRKAANECAVLLKNNGTLPFSKETKKIAVIGPFADNPDIIGWWACRGKSSDAITVKQGIENKLPDSKITVVKGCSDEWNECDTSGINEAVSAANNADAVILCLGEPQGYTGEANCRASLDLPGVQNELAKAVIDANPNTAVLLFTGRPLAITGLDSIAPAILNMWFPGTEGGNSAADLLFGDANPAGKVTMSFPKNVGQCPIYYNHTNTGRPISKAEEGLRKTYRSNYIDCGNLPLYSFGYGLSYSDFVYEGMELDTDELSDDGAINVDITVFNDSNVAGKETVQLYMRDLYASTARPIQQLIAFEKITLAAMERKTVRFTVTEPMLRFWNNKNEFVSEEGEFNLMTGYADNMVFTKKIVLVKSK